MKLICDNCKKEKLKQIGVKMRVGIGYSKIGKCLICKKNNEELYAFSEKNEVKK